MSMPVAPAKVRPKRGYLATPLDGDERRRVDRLYREHGGLVKAFGRKYCRKYVGLRSEDIYSCIDIAFIKTCRAWDATKGAFSTLLGVFSEGEIRHFIRDSNWEVKAPGAVRTLGSQARHMIRAGRPFPEVCATLNSTPEAVKLALFATQSLDHDTQDFSSHICTRPTPWDALEDAEN
jgi:hypothetical protein